jgi:hypothetical protein
VTQQTTLPRAPQNDKQYIKHQIINVQKDLRNQDTAITSGMSVNIKKTKK